MNSMTTARMTRTIAGPLYESKSPLMVAELWFGPKRFGRAFGASDKSPFPWGGFLVTFGDRLTVFWSLWIWKDAN